MHLPSRSVTVAAARPAGGPPTSAKSQVRHTEYLLGQCIGAAALGDLMITRG